MEGFLSQVASSAGISVTMLLACWPTNTLCADKNNTVSEGGDWINETIPLYYVIGLGGLQLVTIIGCIMCWLCSWRRKRKEYFTDEAKEGPREDSTWEMTPSSTKVTVADDKNVKESTKKQNTDVLTIKVKVQSIDQKDEGKSNEIADEREVDAVEQKQLAQFECHADKTSAEEDDPRLLGTNVFEVKEDIDAPQDSNQENLIGINNKGSETDAPVLDNSDKRRAEPVYAEVNKSTKVKKKSGYSVVYAELAEFESRKKNDSLPRGTQPSAEYAEIARLTKSPRDMCPLDE